MLKSVPVWDCRRTLAILGLLIREFLDFEVSRKRKEGAPVLLYHPALLHSISRKGLGRAATFKSSTRLNKAEQDRFYGRQSTELQHT
jgi:hypothetical protein